jgi:trk system potassium uptake protein TrkH
MGMALFAAAGMPVFEAVLNSITGIATGGFTTRNASIGAFGSPEIELIAMVLMVLGATSFFVHARLWNRKLRDYLRNPETRLFWIMLLVFSLLVSVTYMQGPEPFRHGVFQAFSSLTGTGFSNAEVGSGTTKILLIVLMIVGGYAGSTAGGLKLIRSGIILKSLPWMGKKISLPQEAVVPFKFGGKVIKEDELSIIALFASIYLVIMAVSSLGLTFLGYTPLDSVFTVASAEGTVGLSVVPIADMDPAGKLILIANMFLGRLEIIPFLVIVYIGLSWLLHMRRNISLRKRKE